MPSPMVHRMEIAVSIQTHTHIYTVSQLIKQIIRSYEIFIFKSNGLRMIKKKIIKKKHKYFTTILVLVYIQVKERLI